jgi:hypothetical protein
MSYQIKIPATNKTHSVPSGQPAWKTQAISIVKKVKANYMTQFINASNYSGVPVMILVGFASVESGGVPNGELRNATPGIMQMNPSTAWQTLLDQLKKESVTIGKFYPLYNYVPSVFTIKKPLPQNFWSDNNVKIRQRPASEYLELKSEATSVPILRNKIISDAGFAIMIGAVHLAQLFAKTIRDSGQPRLDHIIVMYNAGSGRYNSKIKNTTLLTADTTTLVNNLGIQVSQDYIVKLMGVNGFLDVQKQRLA